MNNCCFSGRAGQDAELRYTGAGQAVASFNLAVDRFNKKDGPIWIKITLWAKQAENLAKFITTGKQLSVAGEIDLETYKNRNDEMVTKLVLNARQVTLLGGGSAPTEETEQESEEQIEEETAPF
jgi:single-strand DNA-binding protein